MQIFNSFTSYSKSKFNELYTGLEAKAQTAKDRFSQLDTTQKTILISVSSFLVLGAIFYMEQFFNPTSVVISNDLIVVNKPNHYSLCNLLYGYYDPSSEIFCSETGWTKSDDSTFGNCLMENTAYLTFAGQIVGKARRVESGLCS